MTSALPKARSTTHGTLMAMDDLAPLRDGSERFAARIVRQPTGAAIVPWDGVTGRALQHDFDAFTGFGQAVAVEVTSATDERLRQLGVELSRTPTNIPRLRGPSWSVDVRSDADLRKVRASVEEVIAELEAEGVEAFSFSVWEDPPVGAPHLWFASHEEDRWTAGMRRAHQLRLHWAGSSTPGLPNPSSAGSEVLPAPRPRMAMGGDGPCGSPGSGPVGCDRRHSALRRT